MFTLKEIGEMLSMDVAEVEEIITEGHLSYTYSDGKKRLLFTI